MFSFTFPEHFYYTYFGIYETSVNVSISIYPVFLLLLTVPHPTPAGGHPVLPRLSLV
jgi:hypothetical protein